MRTPMKIYPLLKDSRDSEFQNIRQSTPIPPTWIRKRVKIRAQIFDNSDLQFVNYLSSHFF